MYLNKNIYLYIEEYVYIHSIGMHIHIIYNIMYTYKYKNTQAFFFLLIQVVFFSVYGQYFAFYFFK